MKTTAQNNVSMFNFMTLWFGAAISVAEILAGGLLAPLGFRWGIIAIILGHLVGTTILVFGGIIGIEERIPALESTRISFGQYGSNIFSVLNVLQLLGWTAVMIITGAQSVNQISKMLWSFDHIAVWSLIIGAFIFVWVWLGKDSGWKKANHLAVILLFLLTLVLSVILFSHQELLTKHAAGNNAFGPSFELVVVMPLSWLPLISDYTRFAKTKKGGTWGSWLGYFLGSSWMYIIGLGTAIIGDSADPSGMLLAAHLGIVALGIIVLSTVTTTFMDAYSSGVSLRNIFPSLNEKMVALLITALGTALAIIVPMEQYQNFLYAIGSVFSPLFAILLTDYFLLQNNKVDNNLRLEWGSLIVCFLGTLLYYQFLNYNFLLGATVPVMLITGVIHILTRRLNLKWKHENIYSKV